MALLGVGRSFAAVLKDALRQGLRTENHVRCLVLEDLEVHMRGFVDTAGCIAEETVVATGNRIVHM
jgi:hypothetical protein